MLALPQRLRLAIQRYQLALTGRAQRHLARLDDEAGDLISHILLQEHEARDAARLWLCMG